MNIHPVNSKEHMLTPEDIFLVAAFTQDLKAKKFEQAVKKSGISKERLKYILFLKAYSDPRLVRIRAGNTLFTIAALPNRIGFVRSYNGDTPRNFINNLVEFFDSARKMGFDELYAQPDGPFPKLLKLAIKQNPRPDVEAKFNSSKNIFMIKTGKPRK